jgi:hypothetical protein
LDYPIAKQKKKSMKNILKLSFLVVALSLMNLKGNAQEQPQRPALPQMTSDQRADRRTDELKSKLKLDESQTAKVREAFQKFEAQRGSSQDDMRQNRETLDAALNGILTAEQQAEYQKIKDARKEQMKARMQENRGKRELPKEENTK